MIVGAYHNDNTGQLDGGAAYVVFGAASGLTTIDLDNVALGIGGFKINSETAEEYAGFAVSAAGDVDGDGFDDLIVGAPLNDAGGGGAGAAYVIFGRDYTNQVDFLGTTGNDSLTGTVADEILIGGQGDDTIDGAGGDDVIIGGSGNDTIIYDPATDTLKVDGGTGTDILSVAGSGVTIDLTAINDGVFEGFERIDLTGGGNTLILAVSDLYAITEDQNALTLTGNTLIVDGNAGDAVDAGGGWLFADADVTIGSDSFAKFTQGTATLYVDNDVDQSAIGIVVPAISLGTVAAGTGGFKIVGENTGDFAGISVSSAGDVNGDGFDDLIVGATGVDGDGYDYGAAYVVYGAASGITAVDLVDVKNGTGGFKIRAEFPGDYAGYSVSSAGDVDGDGIDDLIVGAINEDAGGANSGAAYVVYGAAGGFTAVDLFDIKNGTGGFKITGQAAESETGNSVSSAGDVNGDGFDDLIIGAHFDDVAGTNAGAAYVVFGADGGFTSVNLVNVAAGTGGFKLTGEVGEDEAGFSVSSAGDFNGDGFDDLIVGAFLNDGPGVNAGAAYVVFGAASGLSSLDLSVIAGGTGGFQITAEAAQDRLGVSVSSAGDVNGDGFDDIVVGAYRSNTGGYNAGAAYVVYGSGTPPTAVSLSTVAAGTGGFKIIGEKTGDDAAISVSSAGDVNGDGFDDVLIGAHRNDANGYASGAAYVVFGTASGLTSVELDIIAAGTGGFKIIAEASQDQAGRSVSAAGDVDGDGFDDILVGARLNDTVNPDGGAAYVVFGEDFTNLVDFLGTAGNDVLTGTGANEILIGGQGDDTIDGAGGDDVIIGGSGNDTIIYDSATDTLKVDGGGGTDILSVAGSGVTIDLTAIGDGVFEGFERIDLTGGGNTLILAVSDIYAITERRNALTATGATLIVDGDAGDAVDAGGGWVFVDNAVDIGGTFFTQYTQDAATLYVDNAVDQSAIGLVSPQVDLADVANATGGFKISGLTGDLAGKAVASVGDINGDGFDDVLVGAPDNDVVAFNAGAAYVVFGAASGITAVDLNVVAAGTGGFRILGEASIDRAGYAVAAAGDVNGDGIDDIFVGSQNGGAYVVFGASTPPTAVDLADVAAGTGGFKIVGETTNDNAGDSVASAGDVNGDGIDDLLIAANGNGTAGAAYVVFGVAGGLTAVDLADIAGGTGGFKIIGEASVDQAGSWVASAGDMNGDGFADVIVGAYGNDFSGDPNAGAAYVVFGAATPPTSINLADVANGTGGFKLIGEATDDLAGYSVASAGDINGDGFADVIVSAPFNNNAGGTDAGAAYVLFGAASGLTSIDLGAVAAGTGGFKIIGQAAGDYAGFSVTGAGDVNGDGFDDVIVGAYHNDGTGLLDGGAAYVVFGAASGLTTIDLDDVALGIGGFRINAEIADDHAGYAVSAAGDVDGDGFDDLIVGAPLNDGGGAGAGAGYVIFGRDFTNQVDFLGTAGNDSLTGTGANEILIGGQGDDTIDGAGGDDVIIGGSGNDTIVFDAADTLKVDAGTGTDILSVVGSGVIVDLTAIDDGVFEGFERIDLTGSGNNTLVMKVTDLYAITEGLNADTGSATTLIVDGIAGDVVDAASGWTLENSAVVIGPNTYTEYSQGAATLLVDNDITQAVGLDLGWTNGTLDGSWQTAGNWNLGVVPPDNSDVTITDQTDTVTYSGTTVLNDLDLVDETLRITSGTLTVEGEFTEGASATLILDGGTLNVSPSTLTANGTITFSGGTIAGGTIQTSGTTTLDFENNQFNILDGVTLNGDVDLSVTGARFRVQNGFTLNTEGGGPPGSLTLSGQNSAIGFTGTQTFDDATVLFDASTTGSKILSADAAGTVLTLGPNLTISGGLGFIQQAEFVGGATTIVNQGTISADDAGGTGITIRPSTFSNENAIEAINGGFVTITAASWTNEAGATITATSSTLTFEDDWNNLGTVTVTSSTLNLDGTFTTADIGTLVRSGGTVALKGVLDNTSDTLTFNTASGSWDVSSATITGGTIQFGDGEGLNFLNSGSNFLDGVTINGAVDLSASAARFRVLNGLTLNTEIGGSPGSLTLSGSSSIIAFQGTQLFDNATVTFDAVSSGSKFLAADVAGTVLTLGSGVTISGGRGIITSGVFVGGAATIVNQGTISADANAELITIRPSTFDNENVVEATGGGSLSITSATSFINDGSVTISGGGTLTISAGSWTNLDTRTITATNSSLTLGGDWDNDGTITVTDSTVVLGGTFSTADIGTLTRSGGTVTLTGTIDNGGHVDLQHGVGLVERLGRPDQQRHGSVRRRRGSELPEQRQQLPGWGDDQRRRRSVGVGRALPGAERPDAERRGRRLAGLADAEWLELDHRLPGDAALRQRDGDLRCGEFGQQVPERRHGRHGLTLGSGVTISGGRGIITSGVFVGGAATIVNQGTISADANAELITIRPSTFDNENVVEATGGGSLSITSATSFINDGSVTISGGGTLTITASSWTNLATKTITATSSSLTLGGDWDNDGTITVTDSTVVLGGTFSTADIGTLTRSGGTVTLTGALDNSAAPPLTFNTASGSWNVNSATITGGIIQFGNGEGLNFQFNNSNFLDGVTINGAVDLSASAARFRVLNGLTLNTEIGGSPGSLTLSGSNSIIAFQGTQLFDNATVTFDAVSSGSKFLAADVAGTVLTLGSGVTISGGRGIITSGVFVGGAATIISLAAISANVSAETITISPKTFDNQGTINLANGGTVTMTVNGADYTSSGTINVLGGGDLTINFSGTTPTFTNESGGVINIDDPAGSQLILNGDAADTFINAAGAEINGSAGIINNGVTFTNAGTLNPGLSPGVMTIEGDLYQGDSAVLNIELAGTTPGSGHDQLVVTGEIQWNGTINVTLIDGFEPQAGDSFAIVNAASTTGDLDHLHGLRIGDDMVLGTDFADTGLTLITLQASVENTGGGGNDTFGGGLGDDVIVGNDGDDIIVGGGGADHLYGDAGDDLLVVGGTDFARVDGGQGNDTLAFDGDLDLRLIRGDQIEGIEEIDFSGTGNNLLVLDAENVRAITDGLNTKPDNAALHAKNSLVVTGNAGDTVDLDQFTDTGVDTAVGGRAGYSVYQNADASAQVLVANEVTVVSAPPVA